MDGRYRIIRNQSKCLVSLMEIRLVPRMRLNQSIAMSPSVRSSGDIAIVRMSRILGTPPGTFRGLIRADFYLSAAVIS